MQTTNYIKQLFEFTVPPNDDTANDSQYLISRFETQGTGYQFDLIRAAENLPVAGLPDSRLTVALQACGNLDMEQLVLIDYAELLDGARPATKWNTLISMKARGDAATGNVAVYSPQASKQDVMQGPYFLRFTGWCKDWSTNILTNNSHWHLISLEFEFGWRIHVSYANSSATDPFSRQAIVNLAILKA